MKVICEGIEVCKTKNCVHAKEHEKVEGCSINCYFGERKVICVEKEADNGK